MEDKVIQAANHKVIEAKQAIYKLMDEYNSWMIHQEYTNGHLQKDLNEQIWRFARTLKATATACDDLARKYNDLIVDPD